jgi:cytochrome c oxidase assembly factor CtaG
MSPLGVVAVLGAVASIVAYSRRKATPLRVRCQFAVALLSWALLWYATSSPFAAEGMISLPDHMIAHILVMFMVPIGLVWSGALRSMWWILRPDSRRRMLSWWYLRRTWHAPKWLFHPITATIVLNVVMVASHTPRVFDFMMARTWMMQWVVEPAFLLSGLFFFHFIVSSPPRINRVRVRYQLFGLLVTLFEMLMLAMSMAIFTKSSWYSVMVMHPGMARRGDPLDLRRRLGRPLFNSCPDADREKRGLALCRAGASDVAVVGRDGRDWLIGLVDGGQVGVPLLEARVVFATFGALDLHLPPLFAQHLLPHVDGIYAERGPLHDVGPREFVTGERTVHLKGESRDAHQLSDEETQMDPENVLRFTGHFR